MTNNHKFSFFGFALSLFTFNQVLIFNSSVFVMRKGSFMSLDATVVCVSLAYMLIVLQGNAGRGIFRIDDFTKRKASRVSRAKFDSSNACFNKIFHFCHLGVRYSSGSYSIKTLSKFLETTQHLPGMQGFAFSNSFSAWTLLNLCASFTNCGLLRV